MSLLFFFKAFLLYIVMALCSYSQQIEQRVHQQISGRSPQSFAAKEKLTKLQHWRLSNSLRIKNRGSAIRFQHAGFEILTTVTVKSTIFWDVTPPNLVEIHPCFRGTYCLRNFGWLLPHYAVLHHRRPHFSGFFMLCPQWSQVMLFNNVVNVSTFSEYQPTSFKSFLF